VFEDLQKLIRKQNNNEGSDQWANRKTSTLTIRTDDHGLHHDKDKQATKIES
jgi:hypothetical protein